MQSDLGSELLDKVMQMERDVGLQFESWSTPNSVDLGEVIYPL